MVDYYVMVDNKLMGIPCNEVGRTVPPSEARLIFFEILDIFYSIIFYVYSHACRSFSRYLLRNLKKIVNCSFFTNQKRENFGEKFNFTL